MLSPGYQYQSTYLVLLKFRASYEFLIKPEKEAL